MPILFNEAINKGFQGKPLEFLFKEAYKLRKKVFSNIIYFYSPGVAYFTLSFNDALSLIKFPAISITGRRCYLNCEHCKGKLLERMIPAETPRKLFKVCLKIKEANGEGCLISGGSLKNGHVPLMDFIPTIKKAKKLGLKIVVHTGVIDESLAEALASIDVDGVMIDIIGSKETINKVYHLNRNIESFEHSLSLLESNNIPSIPHIVVGLHFGRLKGEWEALKIVARHRISALVIVALMPLEGTSMENVTPPSPIEVAKVILTARMLMPTTPLLLGCASSKGLYKARLDVLSIKAGVNGIAYPSEEAYRLASKLKLKIKLRNECCSLLWKEFYKKGNNI
ncbi:MAG: radical SAM protein [Candidatus Bathyarchaeia archaeon]